VGEAQQLGEEAVLGRVVEVKVFLKENSRKNYHSTSSKK
jgi:hypothetical protein